MTVALEMGMGIHFGIQLFIPFCWALPTRLQLYRMSLSPLPEYASNILEHNIICFFLSFAESSYKACAVLVAGFLKSTSLLKPV